MAGAGTKMGTSTTGVRLPRPAKEADESSFLGRLASRLKTLREAAGLDPERASAAISKAGYRVAASTIYRWEQGTTQPHLEAFPAIAKAYGASIRQVLPPN